MKVKELLDLQCSFFDNTFSKPKSQVKVQALFDHSLKDFKTQRGKSIDFDNELHLHVQTYGKDQDYAKMKELQCAVTPSGVFGAKRTYEYIEMVNPLLIVDIDDVDASKKYVDSFKQYPWIIGAGQSMSRQGVWLLVYIEQPTLAKEHFAALRDVFKEADDLKDVTRLRYVSYGYTWHRPLTETIKPFTKIKALPIEDIYESKQLPQTTKYDNEASIIECLTTVGSIGESGGLHPWTVRIASRCNRKGITGRYAQQEVWKKIKTTPEVADTVRYTEERFFDDWNSIYETYAHEHHLETKVRISKSSVHRFDAKLYKRSPQVIQDLLATVEQSEEKEVVYFTSIIMLGLLFPNRSFKYFNNTYYPTLYGYILGEAASFKGKAKILRTAFKSYQDRVDELYKAKQDAKVATAAYNKLNKDQPRPVEKVPDLNLFFDGNTSSAALLKAMQDSPVLCMFETEGDTITKTWNTDWGNYSDILRKTFEHESLYSLKKNGNEENLLRIHIQKPKLSVLVSSTEQQMRKVLNSDETENGLMSRFLFYIVQNDKKWYNGWDSNTSIDIEAILRKRLPPDAWLFSCTHDDVVYEMSKEAHQYHQEYFNYVNDNWPDELFSIIALIRRAGTACGRIAMLLEELFALDKPPTRVSGLVLRRHTVSGESMLLAIDIMKVLMQHLFVAWQITYREQDVKETNVQTSETRKAVIDALTKNPKAGYTTIAKELGISREAVRGHIKRIKASSETDEQDAN
jgi:hypothetical protein